MRRAALAACTLLVATGARAAPVVQRHRTEIGDWRLDVARDGFSGGVACRLRARSGGALYQAGAVGLRFRSRRDVGAAVYRVDGGPPRAWRDNLPELIRLAVPIDAGGLDNPTGGVVWIPFRLLADANAVAVQPRPGDRARVFHFRGLKGLLETGRVRGCVPDSRFGP